MELINHLSNLAKKQMSRGNCYYTCEALYHLLGGKKAGYKPMHLRHENESHWYLQHASGLIIDPTASQFKNLPNYLDGKGKGFLTKQPSKKATALMKFLIYQNGETK